MWILTSTVRGKCTSGAPQLNRFDEHTFTGSLSTHCQMRGFTSWLTQNSWEVFFFSVCHWESQIQHFPRQRLKDTVKHYPVIYAHPSCYLMKGRALSQPEWTTYSQKDVWEYLVLVVSHIFFLLHFKLCSVLNLTPFFSNSIHTKEHFLVVPRMLISDKIRILLLCFW